MSENGVNQETGSGNQRGGGLISRLRELPNDGIAKTLIVATLLCLVCSVVVSTAATRLKPRQEFNRDLDRKQNILAVAGISGDGRSVDEMFGEIQPRVIELDTGDFANGVDPNTFDQRVAARSPDLSTELAPRDDIAGLGRRSNYATVYLLENEGELDRVILPVSGYGLWSTLYGFLCVEGDGNTICGISFYEHAETPGLGGEVDNPRWQALWPGQQIADNSGETRIEVVKGRVDPSSPGAEHRVDGLAGATLTSNGVSNLVRFWVGDNGFGPFLQRLRLRADSNDRAGA